jgi:hypothetical protein
MGTGKGHCYSAAEDEQEDLVLVRESLINSLREGKENISIERG